MDSIVARMNVAAEDCGTFWPLFSDRVYLWSIPRRVPSCLAGHSGHSAWQSISRPKWFKIISLFR